MNESAFDSIVGEVIRAVERSDIDPIGDPPEHVVAAITKITETYQQRANRADGQNQPPLASVERMVSRVYEAVVDYGPLTKLLGDPTIEEILIQGDRIWVISGGKVREKVTSESEAQLRSYIDRLLATSAQKVSLDQSNPIVSVGIPGNMRLSVKIPPVTDELTVTIRARTGGRATLSELVANNTLTAEAAGFLWLLIQARGRIVAAGAPSAGKTHLLNGLLEAIPAGPGHIVRINEETPELNAQLPVGGYARTTDSMGHGIGLRQLIKADLRFRAGWLVVGEVRGEEAWELLRPLNAGVGFLSTVHANSAADTIDALTFAASMSDRNTQPELLREMFARDIDVVCFCDEHEGVHRVTEIVWVQSRLRDREVIVEPLFAADGIDSPLIATGAMPPDRTVDRLDRIAASSQARSLKAVMAGDTTVRLSQ